MGSNKICYFPTFKNMNYDERRNNSNNNTSETGRTESSDSRTSTDGGTVIGTGQTNPTEDDRIRLETKSAIIESQRNNGTLSADSIPSDYYISASGKLERIPTGYYVTDAGKLRKRRSDANNARTGSDTGRSEGRRTNTTENGVSEIPIRKVRKKTQTIDTSQMSMAMLGITVNALFGSIALLAGSHWNLAEDESKLLTKSLDTALKTLPSDQYEKLVKYIENFAPWVGLAIVAGSITIPRIEESSRLAKAKRQRQQTETTPNNNVAEFRQTRQNNVPYNSINSNAVNQTGFSGAD